MHGPPVCLRDLTAEERSAVAALARSRTVRWSPSAGQIGGLDKLDPGFRQAANRVISTAPYASFGVCPAKALCGRPAL
jgi:hypothetical protein